MRRLLVGIALACGFAALVTPSAHALRVAIAPPAPVQLAKTDAVVVGRVVGLEPMDVSAAPAKNQPKANYRIAVVQVTEVLMGMKTDTKMVRVGFIAAPMNPNDPNGGLVPPGGVQIQIQPAIQPAIQPFPGGRRPFPPQQINIALQVGQDGMFMLAKHPTESFYTLPGFNSFVNSQNNGNFANEVKSTKEYCKVLENTTASLKSEDRQTRFMAAAVLIAKYRSNPTGQPMKQEPISAEESKLILTGLAQADWNARVNSNIQMPQDLFRQLGIGAADGFVYNNPQGTIQDMNAAMLKWVNENSEKYIIKKLVVDPNAKVLPVDVQPQPPVLQPGVIRPGVRPLPIRPVPGKIQIQPLPAPVPAQPIQLDIPAQAIPVQVLPIQVIPAQPVPVPAPLPVRD